jgi:endonuclease/exonuclease/phosphatase family metal-dependent hydrolase
MHCVRVRWVIPILLSLGCAPTAKPSANPEDFLVVAYNVENLFDVDGEALFEDYGPENYGPAHLLTKLTNIVRVLSTLDGGRGPDIILFQELEADQTPAEQPFDAAKFLQRYGRTTLSAMLNEPVSADVRDLPAEALLLKALHEAGLGPYAVRVGEYRADPTGRTIAHVNATFSRFPIVDTRSHHSPGARSTLEVVHDVHGHRLHTLNVHWKSGASDAETEPIRVGNARVLRDRLNQLLATDPQADIILGGDFNSHYNQALRHPELAETAINQVLGSDGDELGLRRNDGPSLYNLWFELPPERRGSDVYRGHWGTLMQLLIVRGLHDFRGVQYIDNSFGVAIREDLNAQAGTRVPLSWNVIEGTGTGFSDHFPISACFRAVDDADTSRYQTLTNPGRAHQTSATPRPVDYEAVRAARVPAARDFGSDAALRQADHIGRVYRVEAEVSGEKPFRIRLFEEDYNIWAFELELRLEIYRRYQVGDRLTLYGELGIHRGQWQFIVRDASWLNPLVAKPQRGGGKRIR